MTEDANKPTLVIFKAGLGIIPGLPARDMTLEEWEAHPQALRLKGVRAGVYQPPKVNKKKKSEE